MSDPFISEIQIFAGNFAPRAWAFCDNQLLAISSNDALFSLVGTIYGGDGRSTFALPGIRGRTPIGEGAGPALTPRSLGAKSGVENVTITLNQMPRHSHSVDIPVTTNGGADVTNNPVNATFLSPGPVGIYDDGIDQNTPPVDNGPGTQPVGGNQSHSNIQPFLALNYIIALQGVYPSRS